MEDSHKIWPFSDVPSETISIYDGPEIFLSEYANAPIKQRTIFSAYWLQAEVLNGGLNQFFSNDTGVLAPEAVAACRALWMPALADVLERAMAWFGDPYPRDREARQVALASFANANRDSDDPFDKLDDEIVDFIYEENGGLQLAASRYMGVRGGR
jgi:hypothetical protein